MSAVSDMVRKVRDGLQDVEGIRWTDLRIIDAFNLGILEMRRRRPDYFIGRYNVPTYQISNINEQFDLPEVTEPLLVAYAIGWIETADAEVSDDGRAAAMLSIFNNGVRL